MRKKTAILVIDMLNDFVSDGGSLVVPGAKKIVPSIKRRLTTAGKNRIPVIYVCDSHHPKDPEFKNWPRHAVEGSWGAQVVDDLEPAKNDYVIPKKRYSGFHQTSLDLTLRELGVENLIITGVVTNICVYFTAVDGYMRGYKIAVPKNCVIGLNAKDHKFALEQMKVLLSTRVV